LNGNFTPLAVEDLKSIRDWISEDDERSADRALSRIRQTAMMIGQFPLMGRRGGVPQTREFSVVGLPYLIVYRLASETDLDILTIMHPRRRYPPE
jgi:toxin ParE1/3/4